MSANNKLYGCLFLLVIGISVIAGYMVASSLPSVKVSNPIESLLGASPTVARVEVRLVTPSPAVATGPTALADEVPVEEPEFVTATPVSPPTVVAPTFDYTNPTGPSGTATAIVATTATPATTPTPTRTATATRAAYLYAAVGTPVARPDKQCYVGAVFGYVYDEKGQPLQGVQVRVYDPWNHVFTAVTKPAPDTGYYDVIQGSGAATWYVVVIDGLGNQVSPVVTVEHPEGDTACWYQVDFKRTRAQ